MGTEPGPNTPKFPLRAFWILAMLGLLTIAAIPKRGVGGDVATALGWFEIILLVVLSLAWALPMIKRSKLGWVVQVFLGVMALNAAVVGSIFLVLVTCANTGGLR